MSLPTFLSGALLGPALLLAPISHPSKIQAQFSLTSYTMLQTFLTASALSALLAYITNLRRPSTLAARKPAPCSFITAYDANILGGLLQGLGMALAGACPGTGLVKTAVGVPSGAWFVAGGLLGAVAWREFETRIKPRSNGAGQNSRTGPSKITVGEKLGLAPEVMLLLWEAICIGAVLWTAGGDFGGKGLGSAVLGGMGIGAAQATSVMLRGAMVGVSGGYGQAVEWVSGALGEGGSGIGLLGALQFDLGVLGGAWALGRFAPELVDAGIRAVYVNGSTAFLGGALQLFGARMAGGCTSGHGLSGMATFGVASFVTVASIFAGGVGWTALMM
ncbi:MAG: hypothetical protein MMC23_005570 [Stictis urceolatum]|nr:hypothetical protein [Stictis urceolata]